jgi:serine/threonine protein phosphatase 1
LLPEEYPDESEEVRLWTRARSFFDVPSWKDTALDGWTVIHGHTPTHNGYPEDEVGAGRRINIDTGAVFGGRLTCAILAPGEDVRYLYA